MSTAMAIPGNTANTFLVHYFGVGLDGDDRFVVERFKALSSGDIRRGPWTMRRTRRADGDPGARWSRARRPRRCVPDRTEIIICTGLRTRGGKQSWGSLAAGLLCDRRQRG